MIPTVEPLPLRLPRELLVLQPMQGYLDLEPVLLVPGLRCVIGSAESCAMRLTKSDIVQPEHCVVEVIGRRTMLTEWAAESTWLNDRLVMEPCDLVPGDRVSLGPFDFRLRLASADELSYAKSVAHEPAAVSQAVSNFNRTHSRSSGDPQPDLDLFGDVLRETTSSTDLDSHARLTQHISKLLSDLQSQVLTLQGREANLNEQLRQQSDETRQTRVSASAALQRNSSRPPAPIPAAIRPEYEHVLQLLQAERDQLDRERMEFSEEQSRSQAEQLEWSQRLNALESQLSELDSQRSALSEEKDICRALAEELLRDKAQLQDWEDRLSHQEQELASRCHDLDRRDREFSEPPNLSMTSLPTLKPLTAVTMSAYPAESAPAASNSDQWAAELVTTPNTSRPLQTLLTLIAFAASAFFLGINLGDPEVVAVIGWSAALVGAISTVDLLLHRCFAINR